MNKESLDAVLARMMEVLKVSTDSALARALPVNRQTLAGWRKRNSVPYAECIKLSDTHGIALDWLLTGVGPMRRDRSTQGTPEEQTPFDPRERAILELYRALDEDAQREIQSAAEEKKRLKMLEQRLQELEAVVADIKRLA